MGLNSDANGRIDSLLAMATSRSARGEFMAAQECIDKAMQAAQEARKVLLKNIVFFLTYRCNLSCSHCWNRTYIKRSVLLSPELSCENIINTFNTSTYIKQAAICFTGGEIFIRDDVEDILTGIADIGFRFGFISNGCFPHKIERLLSNSKTKKAVNWVILSMDGNEVIHDHIRGKGAYRALMDSLRIIQSHGISYSISTVIQGGNSHALREISELVKGLGVSSHSFELEMRGARYWKLDDPSQIRPLLTEEHYTRVCKESMFPGYGCVAGITKCNIRPDGTVEACATSGLMHPFILGRLQEFHLDFDALWDSRIAEETRRDIRSCAGCASFCER